jgi:hypothetical protein
MENTETSQGFDIHAAAEEIITQESEPATAAPEESSSAGQSEQEPNQNAENQQLGPEEILKQVAEEKEDPGQFADLLKTINGLGMTRNGQPVSVESADQLKDFIQKGVDYTYKTQEHAEAVKAKEAEWAQKEQSYMERETSIAQFEQQYDNVITTNDIIADIITDIEKSDPEAFQWLDGLFKAKAQEHLKAAQVHKQFEGKFKETNEKIATLENSLKQKELGEIKQGWESGLKDLQTKWAAPLKKLGVKEDWEAVEKVWASDASGTMTPQAAFNAVHGEAIQKAQESRLKLLETKTKTQSQLINRSGVGNGSKSQDVTSKAVRPGDYDAILRDAAANM